MELNSTTYRQSEINRPLLQSEQEPSKSQAQIVSDSPRSAHHDKITLSKQGKDAASENTNTSKQAQSSSSNELTQEEVKELTELKARDIEVRAHEQAHLSAAGSHATGGASFTLQKGPDGQAYAVGGEVGIDLSVESDPNATILKMQTIKRAALAPANPSSTDRQVAGQASVKEAQARQEILQEQQEQLLQTEDTESKSEEPDISEITSTSNISPSIGSLKASIAAYEQMSAM